MSTDQEAPKLHIDTDWKAQAQAEKERLAKHEAESAGKKAPGRAGHRDELPEASFQTLVSSLASQAVMGLGAIADQQTGRVVIDLESARFAIDLLAVLEQKTKGNLEKEEADDLRQVLVELRSRYVQINDLVAKQMAEQATAGAAAPDLSSLKQPE